MDDVAIALERRARDVAHDGIVVDDQNSLVHPVPRRRDSQAP
jgi:hypothetical protein